MAELAKLRCLQFLRVLKSAGILYILLAIVICAALWIQILQFLIDCEWVTFGVIFGLILVSVHFGRKDHNWLAIHFKQRRKVYLLDYSLIGLPFVLLYIWLLSPYHLISIGLGIVVISLLPISPKLIYTGQGKFFEKLTPLKLFEIRTAFREHPYILLIYVAVLALSYLHISLLIVHLILLIILVFSAQTYLEPKELITYNRRFVLNKIINSLTYFSLLSLPLYFASLLFHFQFWYLIPVHWFALGLTIWFGVTNKYALYHPDNTIIQSSVQQALFLVFLFLPGLFIACILWNFRLYYKAKNNLNFYYA